MAPHKPVTINGRRYDPVTGLPIEEVQVTTADKKPIRKPVPASAKPVAPQTSRGSTKSEVIHGTPVQRSATLYKRAAKKPAVPNKPVLKRNAPGKHMDIARSGAVSRFAQHPVVKPAAATVTKAVTAPIPKPATASVKPISKPAAKPHTVDKPARVHPLAQRALDKVSAKKKAAPVAAKPLSSKEIKDSAIEKAMATPKAQAPKKRAKDSKAFHRFIIIGGIIVVLIGLLYAAWRLVPTISVSLAASQAGISAAYPEYTPDGYKLSQPVTFSDGEVTLKFSSNSNENYYTVTQTRSSWDSSAVLDNVVTSAAGANYVTTKERGLTIFTYDSSAAWVNGGILYRIDSKAQLSGDQIRKIATSL